MSPRPHELECIHGVGHQADVHGCDGCCGLVFGSSAGWEEPVAKFNKGYYRRQGKKEGIALERERIIKLLEAEMTTLNEQLAQWSEPAWHRYKALEQAIELIKGETNEYK